MSSPAASDRQTAKVAFVSMQKNALATPSLVRGHDRAEIQEQRDGTICSMPP